MDRRALLEGVGATAIAAALPAAAVFEVVVTGPTIIDIVGITKNVARYASDSGFVPTAAELMRRT